MESSRSLERVFCLDISLGRAATTPFSWTSLDASPFISARPLITNPVNLASVLTVAFNACNSLYGKVVSFDDAARIDRGDEGSTLSCCINMGLELELLTTLRLIMAEEVLVGLELLANQHMKRISTLLLL